MKNKILIIGANGQLGQEFINAFKNNNLELGDISEYKNFEIIGVDKEQLDITNKQKVFNEISKGYDFVINCSAYTAVDKAEEDELTCYNVNVLGVQNLAYACAQYDIPLVHFSTDYVYEGNQNKPLCEYDQCAPVTVYGKTKLLGENYIREICNKYFIFRTSWLYGQYGKNFVYTMLQLAEKTDTINVVSDQIGTPTNANDLVYNVLKVIGTHNYGLYNCTGEGQCSWYEFAKLIFELKNKKITVNAISSQDYVCKAQRPKYSVLNNLALKNLGLNFMRDYQIALKSFLNKE